jgi:hypothetical protein
MEQLKTSLFATISMIIVRSNYLFAIVCWVEDGVAAFAMLRQRALRVYQTEKTVPMMSEPASFFCMLQKANIYRLQKNKAVASRQPFLFGWKMGFEPTTFGTTIRRSNQLNYIHRVRSAKVSPIFLSTKF